ncbi:hypothetical protein FQV27_04955 [Paracoccus aurantiacus]|uniref:Uncharacterized protein n=1 Tax=Paracoccus aurantiacus TaxID=2599412 RepID=A0A5C6S9Q7_9RHOB|nr:hypothetical protein [Paracoccus aurantiacus]TXB71196.1 hypothetical protein FQV27_04955 [Paracoccus aurantiacus]
MTDQIDWVLVEGAESARLGAIGFLGDELSVIALFGPDDSPEAVLLAARKRPEIIRRDAAISQLSRRVSAEFSRPSVPDQDWWEHLQSAPRLRAPNGASLLRPGEIVRVLTRLSSADAVKAALKTA